MIALLPVLKLLAGALLIGAAIRDRLDQRQRGDDVLRHLRPFGALHSARFDAKDLRRHSFWIVPA